MHRDEHLGHRYKNVQKLRLFIEYFMNYEFVAEVFDNLLDRVLALFLDRNIFLVFTLIT